MNDYEIDLINYLIQNKSKEKFKIADVGGYLEKSANIFPFNRNKIKWENLINHEHKSLCTTQPDQFMENIIRKYSLNGSVVIIGDHLINFAVVLPINFAKDVISYFTNNIPDHHFLVNEDFSWCFYFSMEDDFDFGMLDKQK